MMGCNDVGIHIVFRYALKTTASEARMLNQNLTAILYSAVLLLTPLWSSAQQNLSPEQIVKKADRARFPDGDVSCEVAVADFSKGKATGNSTYKIKARGSEASLVDTIEPPRQQGQKLLMLSDNLWFISPNIKRPTRISMQQRLTGQVANGDIARTDFSGDYSSVLKGKTKLGTTECYFLELTAKRKDVTYAKLEYWVDSAKNLPLKINFFATSGKLLKVGTYSDFKATSDGVVRPLTLTIEDAIDKSKKSILKYSKIKKDKFDDSVFNKESL